MRAVMLLFDTLNREYLPAYGCGWTKLPNFRRLEEHSLTFDRFYAGSLPCIPARRELHTGRHNFLHRSWGPLEPQDESVIDCLKAGGVYTHLCTDHYHYWEDGGATYHTRFNTWQGRRGQEGDPWMGQVRDPEIPEGARGHKVGTLWRQDWVNREFMDTTEKMPQTLTVNDGVDFIARNRDEDRWFLQLEVFDPHEPFYVQEEFRKLYEESWDGPPLDWPDYGPNSYTPEQTEHLRRLYAALMTMCDRSLGRVLDVFDRYDLWKDTMLIVNTDHGFMLGEKDWMGKNIQPCYEEISHIPFFIWDPRVCETGRRQALCQTVDVPATLAGFFGVKPPAGMEGRDLLPVIRFDRPIRRAALFGVHGGHVNVTDGHTVLMRAPRTAANGPLYEYTLEPMHMNMRFTVGELRSAQLVSEPGFAPCPVLKIKARQFANPYWYGDLMFDLDSDPHELVPVRDGAKELELLNAMAELMREDRAPSDQFERIGLPETGEVTAEWLAGPGARKEAPVPPCFAGIDAAPDALAVFSILGSMLPPDQLGMLSAAVRQAAAAFPGRLPAAALLGMLMKILPEGAGFMLSNILRGYLRYLASAAPAAGK